MLSIKRARHLVEENPLSEEARVLASLVIALESGEPFNLERLYSLELDYFELGIDVLKEWRLARYYGRKAKLLSVAVQLHELDQAQPDPDSKRAADPEPDPESQTPHQGKPQA